MSAERLAFVAEYFDPLAELVRKYHLLYYPDGSAVEMVDLKSKRMFLKRVKVDSIRTRDLFIGASVGVMGRQLALVDYADDYTRRQLGSAREQTVVVLFSTVLHEMGRIVEAINREGIIPSAKMVFPTSEEAQDLFQDHRNPLELAAAASSGPVLALEVMAGSAISKLQALVADLSKSLGDPGTVSAVASASAAGAAREAQLLFSQASQLRNTATLDGSTLALIKPHAVSDNLVGPVLDEIIQQGFTITAMQSFNVSKAQAGEFLEVYKGVVPEYAQMVTELSNGTLLAIEIKGRSEDVHGDFRSLVGPADPEIARRVRPRTLRAKFGQDKVHNTVHCTDLPEDAALEVQYFFRILSK